MRQHKDTIFQDLYIQDRTNERSDARRTAFKDAGMQVIKQVTI